MSQHVKKLSLPTASKPVDHFASLLLPGSPEAGMPTTGVPRPSALPALVYSTQSVVSPNNYR